MPKQIIIAEQHRLAAVFEEDQIQELVVATGSHQVGDIYLGTVENVLPGIDAAFVNIGDAQRNGFIHVTDLGPLRLKRGSGTITELLVPQQKVLVQVMKEPTGTKGPRLTGNITLPGRYLVLMPYGRGVNLSRRISGSHERSRLRALAILIKPAGMGLLVRTEAQDMAEEAIMDDLEELLHRWESILAEASSASPPALLGRDDDFIVRVLRDMYTNDVNRIVVDSNTGLKRVKQQIINWNGSKTPPGILIDHHRERTSILEYFRVNAAIREALKPRVDLPSGGYAIIEPTEALTVIDVNSGSFTSSATARETVLWTNCEAATEIARQLRLRNIAGVIIVDFIDMDSRKDQLKVLQHFEEALLSDKARPQVAQLSELGLVELTRKRQGQNIYELFGHTCKTCNGLGHLVALPGELEDQPTALVDRSYPSVLRDPNGDSDDSEIGESSSGRSPRSPSAPILAPRSGRAGYSSDSTYANTYSSESDRETSSSRSSSDIDAGDRAPAESNDDLLSRRTRRRRIDAKTDGEDFRAPSDRFLADKGNHLGDSTYRSPEIEDSSNLRDRSNGPNRKDYWDSRSGTNPRKRIGGRGIDASPEVVNVEMTVEEQDIYALMGVSPLVLLAAEGESPLTASWEERRQAKSTIVQVISPNQKPMDGNLTQGEGLVDSIPESLKPVANIPLSSTTSSTNLESEGTLGWASEEENVALPATTPISEEAISDTVAMDEEETHPLEQEEEESQVIRRRRRRRSSATEE
ncbi:Rne/Rng family ribonuclease [Roseofilum casamattae]|uniref:Rne/Rng family ribonuclease n=1 Tax=Roseofilum casamattae BLCC-M143 TaxID=3022442 RepID=A0ABT7C096_9CYAN|nr:Rne/Rng family ribonuclease [Roseofilum casamattae]MDJ1184477.1 Rne/Rng family ribonuclease [Roseofilum casamattae BLCC-M143]